MISANDHPAGGRRQMPVAVDIFMLIVAAGAALANRLVSSALPNVPSWHPKQAVWASDTGRLATRNRPSQVAAWPPCVVQMAESASWIAYLPVWAETDIHLMTDIHYN